MAVTRINNNQISDASAGNTFVGINAAVKLQNYSITATKIANNLTYGSDLTIAGNLTVQGNTTTIDTTYTTIEDPILLLASNQTGAPAVDIGFVGERGTANNIAFVWDESASEFVTVYTTTGESNTTISIASYADLHVANANIGTNMVVNGTTSLVGNLIGAVNATGNITGGNLITPGLVTATGTITSSANIIGGNLVTGGLVTATGNITGGNINTAGQVSATGNITSVANISGGNISTTGTFSAASLSASGNITGGNLITGGLISATGNITSTANVAGGNVIATTTVSAPSHIGTVVSVTGNVTGGNLVTGGQVTATGNISTPANISGGNISTTGTFSVTGNINAGNLNAVNRVSAATGFFTGNVDVLGNLNATVGIVYANSGIFYGNAVTGNNAAFAGIPGFTQLGSNVVMQFAGNVNSYSQLNFQNINSGNRASTDYIATADNGTDTSNYVNMGIASSTYNYPDFSGYGPNDAYLHNDGGNLIINPETAGKVIKFMVGGTGNANVVANISSTGFDVTGTASASGNVTGGNLITGGLVTATGNITGGNVVTGGLITATGNVNTSAGVAATGNITGGNLITGGLITATGNISTPANISGGNISTTGSFTAASLSATGNVTGGNLVTSGLITATGNITSSSNVAGGNVIATTTVSAPTYIGTVVSVTGNITGGNLITGGLISSAGNITSASNIAGGNLSVTSAINAVTMSATGNLFVGGNLTVQGNITYQNVDDLRVEDPVIIMGTGPNGAPLTADDGMDRGIYMEYYKSGALGNAFVGWDNSTGNMIAATSVNFSANNVVNVLAYGTFQTGNMFAESSTATGNVVGGNLVTGGQVTATGNIATAANIAAGNISITGTFSAVSLSASGNVTGGNLVTGGQITATGNITSTANVAGGNVIATTAVSAASVLGSVVSASGNVTGGNINTGGQVVATGNVNGGNVIATTTVNAPTYIGTVVSVTGNVTGGNLLTGGLISATGNITTAANIAAGNISITGTFAAESLSATGNITGGNLLTGGLISSTGNITSAANVAGGNVIATTTVSAATVLGSVVSASGNVTGGNLITSGLVTATGNITSTGNIAGGNVIATTTVSAPTYIGTVVSVTGNVTGGNLITGGLISATGNISSAANISGSNIITTGLITATGNIATAGNITANFYFGNGSQLTGVAANTSGFPISAGTSNIAAVANGNISVTVAATPNVAVFASTGVFVTGLVSATGNITSSANVGAANVVGTNLSATGNITGANINTGDTNGLTLNGSNINSNAGRITINSNDSDVDFAVDGSGAGNVFYVDAGTRTASFGSATQTTNAIVAFNASNSILLPVGNTAQRPATGVQGMLRFNSTLDAVEVYDADSWTTVGTPSFTVVTDDQFTGNGSQTVFNLSNAYTTNSVIVSINGVVQIPTSAYSVANTVLTFTEAPQSSDIIDVRGITTTTQVVAISNSPGTGIVQPNATLAQVDITGNLLPTGNLTQSLGSPTRYWSSLYVGGNTIYLGNIQLREVSGQMAFFASDGTTPATISASSVDTSQIANGTSNVAVAGSGGNIRFNVGGTSNVMVVNATGAAIVGDLSVTGNATLSGNILGDRVQNGTTSLDIQTPNGNANISVSGTSNVAVFATTGMFVSGIASVTGNVTGANINTAGLVSATGNINGGNLNLTGSIFDTGPLSLITGASGAIALAPNGSNVLVASTTGLAITGTASASGNITGGNLITSGLISATGAITGAAISGTTISGSGNITGGNLSVGTGTITVNNIVNGGANGVGNIGSATTAFNTVFARATSAQYADLAENYCADDEYAPGTVLSFGGEHEVTISGIAGDRRIAGVVSTNPSYIMNSTLECEYVATVALTGRVPTLVSGPVVKGDMMVSAGNGRAVACATPTIGTVIGKALENHAGGDGVIEVVVGRL